MAKEDSRGKDLRRLAEMLRALMEGDELDAQTASSRFSINPDPARRNLKLLTDVVPGVQKKHVGKRDVFFFSRDAAFVERRARSEYASIAAAIASSFGAAFSKVFGGTNYETELDELRTRTVERLVASRKKLFANVGRKISVICGQEEILGDKQGLLDETIDAVLSQTRVKIRYRTFQGDEAERLIDPYSLVVYDAHLYLVGRRNGELRSYRFARILELEATNERFPYPEPNQYDPTVVFRDSIGVWSGDPPACRILVRLSAEWAVYARHHRWHSSQHIVAENEDGSVDIGFFCRPCPEFEQWVLRFGEDGEVLEPEHVREKIRERLAGAVRRYGTRSP